MAVKSDRLMIWQFAAAPKALRALHQDAETAEWLLLIPRALDGLDLDALILQGAEPGQIARYATPGGDTVYIGASKLDRLSPDLGAPAARLQWWRTTPDAGKPS